MSCRPANESEPSPLTQKDSPAARSQEGLPRRLLVKKALRASLSKEKRTALPTLPSTNSALPLSLGARKWTSSMLSRTGSAPCKETVRRGKHKTASTARGMREYLRQAKGD